MSGESGARRCAVIGAGVLGVCLATRLAEAGASVTLLERDEPGQAATRSSFAWLNSNDKAPRAYHDLNSAGLRAWDRLAARVDGGAWYRPAGNLEWAVSPALPRGACRPGAQAHQLGIPGAADRPGGSARPGTVAAAALPGAGHRVVSR